MHLHTAPEAVLCVAVFHLCNKSHLFFHHANDMHRSSITFKPLISEVNNIDYLVTMVPAKGV